MKIGATEAHNKLNKLLYQEIILKSKLISQYMNILNHFSEY